MKHFILGAALLTFASSFSSHDTATAVPANAKVIPVEQVGTIEKASYMQAYGDTLPPIGYVVFCREHRRDCNPSGPIVDRMPLTAARKAELVAINDRVNQTIAPETDMQQYGRAEYWTYPKKAGDCEDYVLLKRKLLIAKGWPESTLLITVVRDENNQGHAVLTVRTDHGDFILDNKQPQILTWRSTPYSYVKQQSEENPLVWISLVPPDQMRQTPISASQSNN
jgi:predicted transglutaminase-like cysteine proteinase